MKNIFLLLVMSALLMSCQSEEYSTENPDPFCINLLADGNPQELKSWLYDGKSVLGELQTNKKSVAFADTAYAAGAIQIFGIDLEGMPNQGRVTSDLVVELPKSKVQRAALIDWAAPIAWKQGFEAYSDVGQKYLYVKLD